MKAYKGFNHDMTCRGYKFEEGKTYTEDKAELCKSGFHACLDPLEVLRYYDPCDSEGNLRKYHEVELEDVDDKREDDTKVCGKKITIGAELNFADIAKAHVEFVKENLDKEKAKNSTGYYSAATNTGKNSIAIAWGRESKAKAAKGSYIVLAEYGKWNGKEYPILHAKMKKVDGIKIKADTFYKLIAGKFIEVEQ